jgi:predicted DNA-binding protein
MGKKNKLLTRLDWTAKTGKNRRKKEKYVKEYIDNFFGDIYNIYIACNMVCGRKIKRSSDISIVE